MRRNLLAAGVGLLSMMAPVEALAKPVFNRISTFPVALTLPDGVDPKSETSAEIITATPDGLSLLFSDSPGKRIGIIDISDPRAPKSGGSIALAGEPTSGSGSDTSGCSAATRGCGDKASSPSEPAIVEDRRIELISRPVPLRRARPGCRRDRRRGSAGRPDR